MALSTIEKKEIVKKFGKNEQDTGSTQVQVALLTAEIAKLNQHNSSNIHDFAANRGLLIKVGQRKALLNYLKKTDKEAYAKLLKDLNLRG
ncbi:MAG: 30S ribosomal protein S15 [Acholeplasmatales bacterium]|nr:30S ribosomal protein S15 [Acholeplasmatales bacterium]